MPVAPATFVTTFKDSGTRSTISEIGVSFYF